MTLQQPSPDTEQPFISHLIELRSRIIYAVICVLFVFMPLAYYANDIYAYLAAPLLKHLPANSQMVAIDVATPFTTPFKLAFVLAVFISIPVILYQFWAFIAPGLYRHEKRMILPLLVSSTALFYGGAAFAYYLVFPLVFAFLTATTPAGVAVMTDISKYLDFVLTLFFAFGAAFQIPVLTIVLVWFGLISRESLVEKRPYVIVGVFVIAMFLTPPDALSQLMLAIPMCLLFELGLLFSKFWMPKADDASQKELIIQAKNQEQED
jgi:sec-independent protein translocase protein TatC